MPLQRGRLLTVSPPLTLAKLFNAVSFLRREKRGEKKSEENAGEKKKFLKVELRRRRRAFSPSRFPTAGRRSDGNSRELFPNFRPALLDCEAQDCPIHLGS